MSTTNTVLDMPIATIEHGPLREVIENEFELSLHRAMQAAERTTMSQAEEQRLRASVVPQVFLYAMDSMDLSPAACTSGFLPMKELQHIRQRIDTVLQDALITTKEVQPSKRGFWASIAQFFGG
jgi:hypothetical protein